MEYLSLDYADHRELCTTAGDQRHLSKPILIPNGLYRQGHSRPRSCWRQWSSRHRSPHYSESNDTLFLNRSWTIGIIEHDGKAVAGSRTTTAATLLMRGLSVISSDRFTGLGEISRSSVDLHLMATPRRPFGCIRPSRTVCWDPFDHSAFPFGSTILFWHATTWT
jgi:hypothetical protein